MPSRVRPVWRVRFAQMDRNPKITRHFKDLYTELAQIVDAGESANKALRSDGWAVLHRILDAEIRTIDRELDDGRVLTQAEYAAAHGRRGGIRAALDSLRAFAEWAETQEAEERRKLELAATAGRQ